MDLSQIAYYSILHNPVWKWALAVGIAIAAYLLLIAIREIVVSRLRKLSDKTKTTIDNFIVDLLRRQTKKIFLFLFSLLIGTQFLALPETVDFVIGKIVLVVVILQGAVWISGVIAFWIKRVMEKKQEAGDTASIGAFTALRVVAQVLVWSAIVLVILDNFGVDVTAFVAGLGISGIAVALALQNILGDLFASISIALDKPFVVGDFIIVGSELGTIEHIGLKTTRVRSLGGEQIIISNADLLSSRIRNYKRMERRRIVFGFGVVYQTEPAKLRAIPQIVAEIIEGVDLADLDRAHFQKFGAASLDFEVVYYVTVPDYNKYMDVQQEINLALSDRFAEEGITFAYPTQTLYVHRESDNGEPEPAAAE